MKVLIDTCVIIDVLQDRKPYSEEAKALFIASANHAIEGYITSKSIADIHYITHRALHSEEETRKVLNKLFSLFDILDTTGNDCREATLSPVSDYEDAVMICTAAREQMDCIVTGNTKDYSKSTVPVMTPKELIDVITEQFKES